MKTAGFFPAEMLGYARVKPIVPHRRTFRRVACIAFAAHDPRPCYQCISNEKGGHFRNVAEFFRFDTPCGEKKTAGCSWQPAGVSGVRPHAGRTIN